MSLRPRNPALWGLLGWLLATLATALHAQQRPQPSTTCGTDAFTARHLITDGAYHRFYQHIQARYLTGPATTPPVGSPSQSQVLTSAAEDTATLYTVPVVFVIYHVGEPIGTGSNLARAVLETALDTLNRHFAGQFPGAPAGIDTRIRFALAQRTADCQPFEGVARVDARSVPGYQNYGLDNTDWQKDLQLRNLLPDYFRFFSDGFVIIRVMTSLSGANGWAAVGGSVYMSAGVLKEPSLGWILTHEVGHSMNLFHTFEGFSYQNGSSICPANDNPQIDGDRVADTDPHVLSQPYNGCFDTIHEYDQTINPCTGRPFGLIGHNFMSYGCSQLFTPGQRTRMRTFLGATNLLTTPYLLPPQPDQALLSTPCLPTSFSATEYQTLGAWRVELAQIRKLSYADTYRERKNYFDYSCSDRTALRVGQTYWLSIWGQGRYRRVYIDYNNDGVFDEAGERVLDLDLNSSDPDTTRSPLTIPTTAVTNQWLRMRVIVNGGSVPPTACQLPGDVFGSGEAEDYGILVQPKAGCSVVRSIKAGHWSDPSAWSCGQRPALTDAVEVLHRMEVQAGETVRIRKLAYGAQGSLILASGAQVILE